VRNEAIQPFHKKPRKMTCHRCGCEYMGKSSMRKYCDECAVENRREWERKRHEASQ
jgi:hypothetical protein